MATWTTVARGIHQRRGGPFDLSVVVIEGGGGLLVVDTGADPIEAADLLAEIATRFPAPVRWVVNTHAHFDHTFGNQAFGPGSATDAAIHGHAGIAAHFERYEGPRLAAWPWIAASVAEPGPKAWLPNVWSKCACVFTTHRTGAGNRVAISASRSAASMGSAPVSTTRSPSPPSMTTTERSNGPPRCWCTPEATEVQVPIV